MHGPREVLNRMKWYTSNLGSARVEIRHRGVPGDRKTLSGDEIVTLESWYLTLKDDDGREVVIPYHRVEKIYSHEKLLWERRKNEEKKVN